MISLDRDLTSPPSATPGPGSLTPNASIREGRASAPQARRVATAGEEAISRVDLLRQSSSSLSFSFSLDKPPSEKTERTARRAAFEKERSRAKKEKKEVDNELRHIVEDYNASRRR